jgi:hypothetical protein
MIPRKITRNHVLRALDKIDREGVPQERDSRKFTLLRDSKKYPPKYVISLAYKIATGKALSTLAFSGGTEANSFLSRLGFQIVSAEGRIKPRHFPTRKHISKKLSEGPGTGKKHTEHCTDCKTAVENLLAALYGRVVKNTRIDIPTALEAYSDTEAYPYLSRIFSELKKCRGFNSFVRSAKLPPSDFLVAEHPGFLVEFDESQHFTRCREIALRSYPERVRLGFDSEKWIQRCQSLRKRDNDPPFRDEQRAWYDTLRDFLPLTRGMNPTIRLYSREFEFEKFRKFNWCDLSPGRPADVETFAQIIGERASFWKLDFRGPVAPGPRLARIVIDGPWGGEIDLARVLLLDVFEKWPEKVGRVTAIATCGAFVRFEWPSSIPRQQDNRFPREEAGEELDRSARRRCEELVSGGLREKLAQRADYLTIGIDTHKAKISVTQSHIPCNHAELVYVADLRSGALYFTGKSYPTSGQEKGLLRITDLKTHFTDLNGQSALILGCHDLTIFNPRSDATARGWRADVKKAFKKIASCRQPAIVLHHPHTTVKRLTWQHAWEGLHRELSSVRSYLGTGCYSIRDPKNGFDRDELDAVLEKTASPDVLNVVVQLGRI